VPGLYLKQPAGYVAMTETPYDVESDLQALIAQHPEILTDEDAGQGPLLLVRREAPVSEQEDAGGRYSLDHLYIDANGVPTLVEVKRSSDTRGRREVVAQMLDYAANAKTSVGYPSNRPSTAIGRIGLRGAGRHHRRATPSHAAQPPPVRRKRPGAERRRSRGAAPSLGRSSGYPSRLLSAPSGWPRGYKTTLERAG
jgi:hypothetical protein